jgi:hypothetical protein
MLQFRSRENFFRVKLFIKPWINMEKQGLCQIKELYENAKCWQKRSGWRKSLSCVLSSKIVSTHRKAGFKVPGFKLQVCSFQKELKYMNMNILQGFKKWGSFLASVVVSVVFVHYFLVCLLVNFCCWSCEELASLPLDWWNNLWQTIK